MDNSLLKNKITIGIATLAISLVFLFQNCSEVTLEKLSEVTVFSNGVGGQFCTSPGSALPFQLKYFIAYNLTSRLDLDQMILVPDSDMDGIPDAQETGRPDYNFDPQNRRTYGRLDGLCEGMSQAQCTIVASSASVVGPGLLASDLQGFSINGLAGVDSDRDSILDIFEIFSFSDLGIPDDLAHLDSDLVLNYREIQQGRNTRDGRDANMASQNLVSAPAQLVQGSDCGGGNSSYTFTINNMPLVNTGHFTAELFESELSHNSGDNVILVTYSVESGSEKQIYGKYIKINYRNPRGYNLNPNDFMLLGSY